MENKKDFVDYKKEIEEKSIIAFVPKGESMWPIIKNKRQTVIIEKKKGRLSKFDVAFYTRADGVFVLHRVVEVVDGGYVMCGDGQMVRERVNEEAVFGVMTTIYKAKKSVPITDKKYIKSVQKWYKSNKKRARKIKRHNFNLRVKRALKRIFKKGK